jgi:hypothetical protein
MKGIKSQSSYEVTQPDEYKSGIEVNSVYNIGCNIFDEDSQTNERSTRELSCICLPLEA